MKNSFAIFVLVLFTYLNVVSTEARAQRPLHEIHSMLIFNFIKYIEWPAETKSGDFIIAVYGDSKVYEQLSSLYGQRQVKGQSAKIVDIADFSGLNSAHIVYVASSKSREFESIIEKFGTKPTLVITDKAGLGKKGASINFREIGGKLKFEINQAAFDNSKLKISGQLVSMGILI
jgi:hypothetical protein